VTLARIQYNGNWDPEPGGWRRLAALLHNQYRVSLDIKPVKLGAGQLQGMQIAHLTGTEGFKLNDAQRTELQRFIEGGGTLCIDAAGGSPAFASSAETELRALFGNSVTQALASPLPPSHPLYTLSDARIDSFAYRSFARTNLTGSLRTPMLCAIEHDGRVAVLYSRQDLSTGLVGVPVDGVIGYDPETATDIMRNIILYCTTPAKSAAN
jgi:hypothetical protein